MQAQKILCFYRIGLLFFLYLFAASASAQDIHLSQFYNTALLRNPALAGVFTGNIRLQTVYRNQWQSAGFPYQTNALSFEYKIPVGNEHDFLTVGSSIFYDQAGIMQMKTVQAMPVVNFHKNLNAEKTSYLSAGFMAGYVSRQFDGKHLTFDNQYTGGRYSPANASGEQFFGLSKNFLDVAVGLSYNGTIHGNAVYYLGSSFWHFNKPSVNFLNNDIRLNPKWQFNAGVRYFLNDRLRLTFEANHLQQAQYRETIAGGMLQFQLDDNIADAKELSEVSVGFGAYMRLNDAAIPAVQVNYSHWNAGLSYDVNISRLKAVSQGRGGFEFSLSYSGFTTNQNSLINSVRCPRF